MYIRVHVLRKSSILMTSSWRHLSQRNTRRTSFSRLLHSFRCNFSLFCPTLLHTDKHTLAHKYTHSFTSSTTTAVTCEHCEGPSHYLGNTTLEIRVGPGLMRSSLSNSPSEGISDISTSDRHLYHEDHVSLVSFQKLVNPALQRVEGQQWTSLHFNHLGTWYIIFGMSQITKQEPTQHQHDHKWGLKVKGF